ncbi:hypothetical protein B0H19DRAFT_1262937 [Mycena capillaripes]|nr:hypothetical protein B0H19DRAFT_1262937 [Mycena capillaripes]
MSHSFPRHLHMLLTRHDVHAHRIIEAAHPCTRTVHRTRYLCSRLVAHSYAVIAAILRISFLIVPTSSPIFALAFANTMLTVKSSCAPDFTSRTAFPARTSPLASQSTIDDPRRPYYHCLSQLPHRLPSPSPAKIRPVDARTTSPDFQRSTPPSLRAALPGASFATNSPFTQPSTEPTSPSITSSHDVLQLQTYRFPDDPQRPKRISGYAPPTARSFGLPPPPTHRIKYSSLVPPDPTNSATDISPLPADATHVSDSDPDVPSDRRNWILAVAAVPPQIAYPVPYAPAFTNSSPIQLLDEC